MSFGGWGRVGGMDWGVEVIDGKAPNKYMFSLDNRVMVIRCGQESHKDVRLQFQMKFARNRRLS